MPLDANSLLVVMCVQLVTSALLFALAALTQPNEPAIRFWALGSILNATGALLSINAGEATILRSLTHILLVDAGLCLVWFGVRRLFDRPLPWKPVLVIGAFIALCVSAIPFVMPKAHAWFIFDWTVIGIICAVITWEIHSVRPASWQRVGLAFEAIAVVQVLGAAYCVITAIYMLATQGYIELQSGVRSTVITITVTYFFVLSLICVLLLTEKLREEVNRHATFDMLTGLLNRRAFTHLASAGLAQATHRGAPASLLLIDIDRFKLINDTYGHEVGDGVLRQVSERLHASLRADDILGRIGGEEFAVFLPCTSRAAAEQIAERVRLAVAGQPVLLDDLTLQPTLSIGVSVATREDTLQSCLSRADKALYAAKHGGRNRVMVDGASGNSGGLFGLSTSHA